MSQQQEMVNKMVGNFLFVIVRGVTLKQPRHVRAHGHRDVLFIQAEFLKSGVIVETGSEESTEVKDLMLLRCPNFTMTPATEIVEADFKGEWPPKSLIQEMERQILVPNAAQSSQILGRK